MQIQIKRDLTVLRIFIRSERLRRNISQENTASYLGISQNSFSKIELGRVKISVEQLLILADIFEMRITDLLNLKKLTIVLEQRERSDKLVN